MASLPDIRRLDRRRFLAAVGGALVWTACGNDGGGSAEAGGDGPFLSLGFSDGIRTPSTFIPGREQRMPLSLTGSDGFMLTDDAPASIEVAVSLDGESVGSFEVARHREGILTPIYPLRFTPPEAGVYDLQLASGVPRQVRVAMPGEDEGEVGIVQPGDPMRPVETPTVDDARGVTPICTRRPEPCPFHDVTLTAALDERGPVVLLVATPAFCQTSICGPVLELLIEAADRVPDATIVHAEVYVDPEGQQGNQERQSPAGFGATTPVIETYSLTYEPSLVVADAEQTVVERLDYAWDRTELVAALDSIS